MLQATQCFFSLHTHSHTDGRIGRQHGVQCLLQGHVRTVRVQSLWRPPVFIDYKQNVQWKQQILSFCYFVLYILLTRLLNICFDVDMSLSTHHLWQRTAIAGGRQHYYAGLGSVFAPIEWNGQISLSGQMNAMFSGLYLPNRLFGKTQSQRWGKHQFIDCRALLRLYFVWKVKCRYGAGDSHRKIVRPFASFPFTTCSLT